MTVAICCSSGTTGGCGARPSRVERRSRWGIHADETDARVLGDAKQIKSPAVHPDGSRIAFAMAELDDSEILTLENFLPVGASN